tara:strand:+ start:3482 stop:3937 length:456 start_codon:yes stop_codon:yes gene_type:complete
MNTAIAKKVVHHELYHCIDGTVHLNGLSKFSPRETKAAITVTKTLLQRRMDKYDIDPDLVEGAVREVFEEAHKNGWGKFTVDDNLLSVAAHDAKKRRGKSPYNKKMPKRRVLEVHAPLVRKAAAYVKKHPDPIVWEHATHWTLIESILDED